MHTLILVVDFAHFSSFRSGIISKVAKKKVVSTNPIQGKIEIEFMMKSKKSRSTLIRISFYLQIIQYHFLLTNFFRGYWKEEGCRVENRSVAYRWLTSESPSE